MRAHFTILLAIWTAVSALACLRGTGAVSRDEVVGVYSANYGKAVDEIEVRSNGEYVHRYPATDGLRVEDTGSWTFEVSGRTSRLTFRRFRFMNGIGSPIVGYWDVEVSREGSRIRLPIDDDLGFYYEK